ncbi:hypothetical protein [Leekyejoonella antrihumi]|uniref:GNAT family N-acetyltransferase n=1 Tax=Leekyejoonella antrihumi TaxID=1660198 RepID=A0A563DRR1_9MICO|nr:hypothetical protein [Leekyejoonella antrihumi]TWP32866.1 hypothetical protein FGL98_23150 [Leekyejoonella antrihumi]
MSMNSPLDVRPVEDDQWQIVAWLWQAYRNDLAPVVNGLPYADGRYQARELNTFPHEGAIGYLAWRPHPNTGEDAPIGFALVDGLADARCQGPLSSAQRRSRDLLGDGHEFCPVMAMGSAQCWPSPALVAQFKGLTPCPESA